MEQHWNKIYAQKSPEELSWTQAYPEISLHYLEAAGIAKDAPILDAGAGESTLVDCLLDEGYTNITLLDISQEALNKVKIRLGEKAEMVKFIVADILEFQPEQNYMLWHDRAVFHFLTNEAEQKRYIKLLNKHVSRHLILGTFSENGPEKCSGLPVQRYAESQLTAQFIPVFKKVKCEKSRHITPFNTQQEFLFCAFTKSHPE